MTHNHWHPSKKVYHLCQQPVSGAVAKISKVQKKKKARLLGFISQVKPVERTELSVKAASSQGAKS